MQISWVNPKLTLKKSKVEGIATFAKEDIRKNEILIIQGGRILSIEQIDEKKNQKYAYHGFQIKERFYICPIVIDKKPLNDGIFLVNHSCNPNAGMKDAITLISMKKIKKGEEILFDYAMVDYETANEIPWVPMKCNCHSKICRKQITGSDWKIKDLQIKYSGYFSPYIQEKIGHIS